MKVIRQCPYKIDYTADMTPATKGVLDRGCLKGYIVKVFRLAETNNIVIITLHSLSRIGKFLLENMYKFHIFKDVRDTVVVSKGLEKS